MICLAILGHGGLTLVSFSNSGYPGLFPPLTDPNTTQVLSDLVLALSFVNLWVFFDLNWSGSVSGEKASQPMMGYELHSPWPVPVQQE